MTIRCLVLAVTAALLPACKPALAPDAFKPLAAPGADLLVLPESERSFRRIVLGLHLNVTKQFLMPSTEEFDARSDDPRVRYLRRRLYWMSIEILHGQIFKYGPPHSRFFVAVPDGSKNPGSLGNEEEVFRDYLVQRLGWTEAQIRQRVRFYKISGVTPFPQDTAEVLGRDSKDRIVLGMGADVEWNLYRDALERLVKAFPDDFALHPLETVNTEGGDLEMIWMPEGRVGLMVGNHRIRRYISNKYGIDMLGRSMTDGQIREAKDAFSRAFFGLEVLVLGEDGLRNPLLISEELFHADMVANIMRKGDKVLAFVPAYREKGGHASGPLDAISGQPLAPEIAARLQRVYDRAAKQLAKRGYEVVRLPFSDHPVRNPVNVGKFVDPVTGSPTVLLGKYPYHYPLGPDGVNPQREIQAALDVLSTAVQDWREKPGEARWKAVLEQLDKAWASLDAAVEAPNPDFQEQLAAYEGAGIRVLPMPIYPSGEGGLHCLLLN